MDQEVAKTLGELEIKLQELERELTSIGKRDVQPSKLAPRQMTSKRGPWTTHLVGRPSSVARKFPPKATRSNAIRRFP
jgi:hypothetical protein